MEIRHSLSVVTERFVVEMFIRTTTATTILVKMMTQQQYQPAVE
jgi:hypothetical protein